MKESQIKEVFGEIEFVNGVGTWFPGGICSRLRSCLVVVNAQKESVIIHLNQKLSFDNISRFGSVDSLNRVFIGKEMQLRVNMARETGRYIRKWMDIFHRLNPDLITEFSLFENEIRFVSQICLSDNETSLVSVKEFIEEFMNRPECV